MQNTKSISQLKKKIKFTSYKPNIFKFHIEIKYMKLTE